jgi:hypothetical protein
MPKKKAEKAEKAEDREQAADEQHYDEVFQLVQAAQKRKKS